MIWENSPRIQEKLAAMAKDGFGVQMASLEPAFLARAIFAIMAPELQALVTAKFEELLLAELDSAHEQLTAQKAEMERQARMAALVNPLAPSGQPLRLVRN